MTNPRSLSAAGIARRTAAVLLVLTALLVATVFLAACGPAARTPTTLPTSAEVNMTGSESASSFGIFIRAGGQVVWTLSENPSTGYEWSFRIGLGVEKVKSTFKGPSPSASPGEGAPGRRTVTFRVPQPGLYFVTARYTRPWESSRPARRYRLTIYANPAGQPAPKAVYAEKNSPAKLDTDVGAVVAVVLSEPKLPSGQGTRWVLDTGPGLTKVYDHVVEYSLPGRVSAWLADQHVWLLRVDEAGTSTANGRLVGKSSSTKSIKTFSLTINAK